MNNAQIPMVLGPNNYLPESRLLRFWSLKNCFQQISTSCITKIKGNHKALRTKEKKIEVSEQLRSGISNSII